MTIIAGHRCADGFNTFFSWGEVLVSTLHKVLLLGLHVIFKYQLRTAYCFQYQIEQHGVSKV